MAGVEKVDSPLLSKCLDFCQALASQGHAFNFSVAIGPSFTFSLDTRSKAVSQVVAKKKPSPSTLRRNAKRREEFIAKKQLKPSPRISSEIKCDQCEYVAASEKGLRQHIRMKHKEELRSSHEGPLHISISPLLDASREELLNASMEEPTTPFIGMCRGDDCNVKLTGMFCCEETKLLCEDCCGHF